mgnify:CR=1 FL=1
MQTNMISRLARGAYVSTVVSLLSVMPAASQGQGNAAECCDQLRAPFYNAELTALDLRGGEDFMVPSALSNVAGVGALLSGQTLSAKLSDPEMRAEVYSEAILSAIAADELGRLHPEAARSIGGDENLEAFARATDQTSNVVAATADIKSGVEAIEAVNRARRMGSNVNAAQAAAASRFQSSPLGKASTDLAVLSLAVNLATDFKDEADRATFLGEAIRDARIIGALKNLEVVLQAVGGQDPAMLQGIADARTRLTELSENRLERMVSAGAAAFDSNKTVIAALALGHVASGGASLVAREVMELGVSVDEFTAQTISIAAMHNIAAASLAPIKMLGNDDISIFGNLPLDEINVTQLGALNARLAAEANAATYTLLWTDRWQNPTSLAGLGKALGMTASEALGAGDNLKERYRRLVSERGRLQIELWNAAIKSQEEEFSKTVSNGDFFDKRDYDKQLYMGVLQVYIPSFLDRDETMTRRENADGDFGPWFYGENSLTMEQYRQGHEDQAASRFVYAERGSLRSFERILNLRENKGCEIKPLSFSLDEKSLGIRAFTVSPPKPNASYFAPEFCKNKTVHFVVTGLRVLDYPVAVKFSIGANNAGAGAFKIVALAEEIASTISLNARP